ncbi:MAG: exodeoxyribonuclease VII small subunit [Candidatus Dormibacteria bacterium]
MNPDDAVTTLSYETALGELDDIIGKLEGGAVALDEAITFYERGAQLARHCAQLLDRTEQKVSQLVIGGGGTLIERPLVEDGAAVPSVTTTPSRNRGPVDPDEIPF